MRALASCRRLLASFAPSCAHHQQQGGRGLASWAAAGEWRGSAVALQARQQLWASHASSSIRLTAEQSQSSNSSSNSSQEQQQHPQHLTFSALGIPITLPAASPVNISSSINTPGTTTNGSDDGSAAPGPAAEPLLCIKRTWQPNLRKRKVTHGFMKRWVCCVARPGIPGIREGQVLCCDFETAVAS